MNIDGGVNYAIYNKDTRVITQIGSADINSFNVMSMCTNDLSPVLGKFGIGMKVVAGVYNIGDIISESDNRIVGRITNLSEIMAAISSGDNTDTVTKLVAKTEEVINGRETVRGWIGNHYCDLRAVAYPSLAEFADAYVKVNSSDEALQVDGARQMQSYVDKCLAVKASYPKAVLGC